MKSTSPPSAGIFPGSASEDRQLPSVLRVSPEPFRYYREAQIHHLLTARPTEYLEFARRMLIAIATGRAHLTLPAKQIFADPASGGDFRVMPCEIRNGDQVTKTVKIIGTNTVQQIIPDQITVGKAFVLDPRENFVTAVFEACLLSSARTGLCAALAIEALAAKREQLVVIGSGRVGFYAALYAAAAGAKRISFTDANRTRALAAARSLSAQCAGVECAAAELPAVRTADVVVLATTSTRPVLKPPAWDANLVVSLGADTQDQRELDPAWCKFADLYVDTRDSLSFGDLLDWQRQELLDTAAVTDLIQVMDGTARTSAPARPRVFISTGSALFDNLTIRYLLDSHRAT